MKMRKQYLMLAATLLTGACGAASCDPLLGTYGDPNGIHVDLKSGGKAAFTFMNQTQECTYTIDKENAKKVSLDCKEGQPIVLTLSDDGTTLMPPSGSLIAPLKKAK